MKTQRQYENLIIYIYIYMEVHRKVLSLTQKEE